MMLKRTFSAIDLSAGAIAGPSKIPRVEGARDVKLKLQRSLTPPQLNPNPNPRPPPPPPPPVPVPVPVSAPPPRKPLFPIPGLAKRAAMYNQQQRERGAAQLPAPLSSPFPSFRSRSPLQPVRAHGLMQRIRRRSSPLAPPAARTTRQLSVFQPPPGVALNRERSDLLLRTALLHQFGADKTLKFWRLRERGIGIS